MRSPCPDERALTQFLLGKLDAAEAEAIGDHVAECSACVSIIQRIQAELLDAPVPSPGGPAWGWGQALADRLKTELRLPWRETVRIAREISLSLAAAHEDGRPHGNLRPETVWLEMRDAPAGGAPAGGAGPRVTL